MFHKVSSVGAMVNKRVLFGNIMPLFEAVSRKWLDLQKDNLWKLQYDNTPGCMSFLVFHIPSLSLQDVTAISTRYAQCYLSSFQ